MKQKSPNSFESGLSYMVPEDGLEPSRPKATDFESVVSTNSTTPARGDSKL